MSDRAEVVFVAGEPSGDLHAGLLAEEMAASAEISIQAVGGARLAAAGAEMLIDSSDWGVMGLPAALRQAPVCWLALRRVRKLLVAEGPALLVLVDFGAGNMHLLRKLGLRRPRCFYYFPPGSWSRERRDYSELARLTDCVATPFPWSEKLLRAQGVNAHFVGHPVIDRVQALDDASSVRRELGVPEGARCLGLLPGSRAVERRLLGPEMIGAAAKLMQRMPDLYVLFSPPPSSAGGDDRHIDLEQLGERVSVVADSIRLMQASDLVITAFGTATLEAAAALCPMIGVYRGTWAMWLQFRLMKMRTDIYAMPNIIAGERIVPEFIQPDETSAERLAAVAGDLLDDEGARLAMKGRLRGVRELLGPPGATQRAAALALMTMAGSG